MTNLRRLDVIRLLAFSMLLLILPATSWAQQRPPIAEQMAKTYGLDSFGQVEGIRYTFNAEFPGVKLSRAREWNPKTDTVSYEGKDKEGKPLKVTSQRSQLDSQSDAVKNEIDRGVHLPPGRNEEARHRDRDVGGLQKGRSAPDLHGSPRDGGRKAAADFLFGCVR